MLQELGVIKSWMWVIIARIGAEDPPLSIKTVPKLPTMLMTKKIAPSFDLIVK